MLKRRKRHEVGLNDTGILEDKKKVPTFGEYADTWINTTVLANCRESTVRDYKDMLRIHVLPIFEKLELTNINRKKIK